MAEELGKISKPAAEEFKKGRKLFFVPLLYGNQESPSEYLEKFNRYWQQVEAQISDLEMKLGPASNIYHELVSAGGEDGVREIQQLNEKSYELLKDRLDKGAAVIALEDADILSEFLDWNRCLAMGLQNEKVAAEIYKRYFDAGQKRREHIARQLDETLKPDETGLLLLREGHQVQFAKDIQVFYVAPPALDEINRWLRDLNIKAKAETEAEKKEGS